MKAAVAEPPPRGGLEGSPRRFLALAGTWSLLALLLTWRSWEGWGDAWYNVYRALGMEDPFDLAAMPGAVLGHAAGCGAWSLLILAAFGAGWPLPRLVRADRGVTAAGLRIAAGAAIVATAQHGLGLAGLVFGPVLAALGALWLALGAVSLGREWRSVRWRLPGPGRRLPAAFVVLALVVLVPLARLPDTHEDARIVHFAVPEHQLALHKVNLEDQNFAWNISLGFEMAAVLPWHLGGVAGVKATNFVYLAATCLLLFGLANRLGPGTAAGWWAAVWYLTAGMVANEVWHGKNDLAVAMHVTAAAACLLEAARGRSRWAAAAGWFLGAGAGVKYPVVFAAVGLAAPAAAGFLRARGRARFLRAAPAAVGLGLVPVGGYMAANFLQLGNPFYPFLSGVFPTQAWGPEYLAAMREVTRSFSPAETWSAQDLLVAAWRVFGSPVTGGPALMALLPLAFLRRPARGGVLVAGLALTYALWTPTERVARYIAPVLPIAAALCAAVPVPGDPLIGRWWRRGMAAFGGASLVILVMNAMLKLEPYGFHYLLGQMPAAEVVQMKYTSWNDVRAWVNASLPRDSRILFTGETRRIGFAPRVISYSNVTEPLLYRAARDSRTIGEMRKRLRQRGIDYHLYNYISADYRGTVWWPGPPWTPRELVLYQEFLARYYRRVFASTLIDHTNGGYYVYEVMDAALPEPAPLHYLPFTEGRFRVPKALAARRRFKEAYGEAVRLLEPVERVFQYRFTVASMAEMNEDYAAVYRLTKPGVDDEFIGDGNWVVFGNGALMTRRYREAARAYSRGYRLYRNQRGQILTGLSSALGYLGLEAYREKRYAKALEFFREALKWQPEKGGVHHYVAMCLVRLNRFDEALVHARRAAALLPGKPRVQKLLRTLEAMGGT